MIFNFKAFDTNVTEFDVTMRIDQCKLLKTFKIETICEFSDPDDYI